MKQRENWGTRFGFILAAAGSAIGLGNIWRFPYMAGENGGAAFILIYIVFAVVIGFSVMLAEFTVGRKTSLSSVGAFKKIDQRWTFVGVMGVLAGFFIMAFYPVVGGWAIGYAFKSVTGLLNNPEAIGGSFGAFIGSPVQPLFWTAVFLVLNVLIVVKGIASGIEKASKVLMPVLLGLLVIIAIRSVTLPGAGAGLAFLFTPDFSAVTGRTYLAALGQAFFSLSLGMGCMITYGSYLSKEERLPGTAAIVTVLDTSFAILAGVVIFPALFAFGMEPAGGPGLVFVVLPSIFAQMGGIGTVLAFIFFIALSVAALTSSVSLLEVVVSYLIDQRQIERKKAVIGSTVVMAATNVLTSLSLGVMSGVTFLGAGAFDVFDILSGKIFLPIGGMLLAIFVGWVANKEELRNEITNGGLVPFPYFDVWYNVIKYVIPVAIGIVSIRGIMDIEQTGLMIFGLAMIALMGVFSKKLT